MAKHKVDFGDVLDGIGSDAEPSQAKATPTTRPKKAKAETAKRAGRPKTVDGPRVLIGGHFPPEFAKQLALIAAEEGVTKQALLGEALNALFLRKGKEKLSL